MLSLFLVTGVIISCLTACSKPAAKTPVVYPSGWPIASLTAPPGAYAREIVTLSLNPNDPSDHDTYIDGMQFNGMLLYAIGFTSDLTWDEAVEHVEGCLSNYEFEVTDSDVRDRVCTRWYRIANGDIEIHLYREDTRKDGCCWHIMIRDYE